MTRSPYDLALRKDPVMRRVIDAVGPQPAYYRERTDFETACRIIVGQQLCHAALLARLRADVALFQRFLVAFGLGLNKFVHDRPALTVVAIQKCIRVRPIQQNVSQFFS